MRKGNKIYSILNSKCPHCHEGDFFSSKIYSIKNMGDIYDDCPVCGETYNPETGFYFGALYISYALGTSLFFTIWGSFNVLGIELEILHKIIGFSIIWILLTPITHRFSKIIWANIFMKYKILNKKE